MLTISEDGSMLRIFGRRILRTIYGPTDMVYGKKRYNNKLYTLYNELGLVEVIKILTKWKVAGSLG
jgi:hypothetical protein